MKLFKVNDTTFINPTLITSIRVRPSIGYKIICISLNDDEVHAGECPNDEEARAQLTELVERINAFTEDTK